MEKGRYRRWYTCSVCGEDDWVYASCEFPSALPAPTHHNSCRNLVGYIKSARHWQERGHPELAEDIRKIIAELWADSDVPYVSVFQRDMARRFLAGEDVSRLTGGPYPGRTPAERCRP